MLPTLRFLSDREERRTSAIYGEVYRVFSVTAEERRRLQPSGQDLIVQNRIRWALLYMKKAKVIEAPRHGVVRIASRGLSLLESHPSKVDVDTLMKYPEFREFRTGTDAKHHPKKSDDFLMGETNAKSVRGTSSVTKISASKETVHNGSWNRAEKTHVVDVDGARTNLGFSAAHFISGHDPCGRLHGHNFCVKVNVEGRPDEYGMVVDFFTIEGAIRSILTDMDHKILIAKRHAIVADGIVRFMTTDGEIRVPRDAVAILDVKETTSELLADHILSKVLANSDLDLGGISSIAVGITESDGRVGWSKMCLRSKRA